MQEAIIVSLSTLCQDMLMTLLRNTIDLRAKKNVSELITQTSYIRQSTSLLGHLNTILQNLHSIQSLSVTIYSAHIY